MNIILLRIYKHCLFQFSPRVFGSLNGHLPTPGLDHVYREVFCRLGSTLGSGFITTKPKISRFVTNKGSRQGKVRSQNLDEDAITPSRRHSKTPILSRNVDQKSLETVFDCHLSPHWQQMAIENTVSIDF